MRRKSRYGNNFGVTRLRAPRADVTAPGMGIWKEALRTAAGGRDCRRAATATLRRVAPGSRGSVSTSNSLDPAPRFRFFVERRKLFGSNKHHVGIALFVDARQIVRAEDPAIHPSVHKRGPPGADLFTDIAKESVLP